MSFFRISAHSEKCCNVVFNINNYTIVKVDFKKVTKNANTKLFYGLKKNIYNNLNYINILKKFS